MQGLAYLLKIVPPQAMRAVMPQTRSEMIFWVLMSLTAGFSEEVIFRGYLQRQFSALTHSHVAGIVLQAIAFGLGHGYQGWKLPVGFTSSTSPSEVPVPVSSPLYAGAFDNAYYSSDSGMAPSGNLYVCPYSYPNPVLFRVAIVDGTLEGYGVLGSPVGYGPNTCSPTTEFFNPNGSEGPEDLLFFSVTGNSVQNYSEVSGTSDCLAGGCLMSLVVSVWQPGTSYQLNQYILDSNGNEELVIQAGTSGGSTPSWLCTAFG